MNRKTGLIVGGIVLHLLGLASPLLAEPKAAARLPIVIMEPVFPRKAQSRGIEGYCVLSFMVTASGHTRDIVPVDCSPAGYFEKAAVRAAKRLQYKPVAAGDGSAAPPERLQHRFEFRLNWQSINTY